LYSFPGPAGERWEVIVAQGPLWLTEEGLAEFQRQPQELQARMGNPDPAGTQARVLVTLTDLEERPMPSSSRPRPCIWRGTVTARASAAGQEPEVDWAKARLPHMLMSGHVVLPARREIPLRVAGIGCLIDRPPITGGNVTGTSLPTPTLHTARLRASATRGHAAACLVNGPGGAPTLQP
jgi:hypothetical protein